MLRRLDFCPPNSLSGLVALWVAAVVLVAVPASAETPEARGLSIAKKVDAAADGFGNERSASEMVLINAQGDKVTRKMHSQSLEVKGDGDRSVITFDWPADVKGTRMLTHAHKTGNDDQWLFLPAYNKVKRISSRNKSGSFMGSEFAYEDISAQELDKFTYKWLRDEKIAGRDCWVLERIPTYKSGYSKQVSWIDQGYLNAVKVDYYDRKGELLKTSTMKGYTKYGTWWRWGRIDIINHQTRKRSTLTISDRKLGEGVDETDFEKRNLGE
ncbi:MAG: hypothetical protein ACI9WU_004873 [Myxococcota bacterium]|jgi:hypothetical protein